MKKFAIAFFITSAFVARADETRLHQNTAGAMEARYRRECPEVSATLLKDLSNAVAVIQDGKQLITVRDEASSLPAKERIREWMGKQTLEQLATCLNHPVDFQAYDYTKKKYVDVSVPSAFALFAAAVSEKVTNPQTGEVSRKLTLSTRTGRKGSLPIFTKSEDTPEQVSAILTHFASQKDDDGKTMGIQHSVAAPIMSDRPQDFDFKWGGKDYVRTSYEADADAWDLRHGLESVRKDPEYVAWQKDHSKSPLDNAALENIFTEPKVKELIEKHVPEAVRPKALSSLKSEFLFDGIPWSDLSKMVRIVRDESGKISIDARDDAQANATRREWLRSPYLWKLQKLMSTSTNKFSGAQIEDAFGQTTTGSVNDLGAVLAIALSQKSVGTLAGRQLLLSDDKGTAIAMPLSYKQSEEIGMVRRSLDYLNGIPDAKKLTLAAHRGGRPSDEFFSYSPKERAYVKQSNAPERDAYDAASAADRIANAPETHRLIIDRFIDVRNNPNVNRKPLVKAKWIQSEIAKLPNEGQRKAAEHRITQWLNNKFETLKDSRSPYNVSVDAEPASGGQNVIAPKDEKTPRIAVVIQSDVGGMQFSSAQNCGAETSWVSGPDDAAQKIQEAYRRYGKKVDVIFCSHGNSSFLQHLIPQSNPFDANDPTTRLINSTENMINRAYFMGCNVGVGADTNPDHIIRRFVARGAKAACGVTPYISFNGSYFFPAQSGYRMLGYGNYYNHPWRKGPKTEE